MIVTDGVFFDGCDVARLPEICDLAERYDALVMVAIRTRPVHGKTGKGTTEHAGCKVASDMITTTFGKALGGASGGWFAAHREIIDLLRQRSRPYLFSNTLAPSIAAGTLAVLEMLSSTTALRDRLEQNTQKFRKALRGRFEIKPGVHPNRSDPALRRQALADHGEDLLDEDIYVIGFYFPVVPKVRHGSASRSPRRTERPPRPRDRGLREGLAASTASSNKSARAGSNVKIGQTWVWSV